MPNSDNLTVTIVKNAFANLARLAGSGVIALVLPAVLVRMLPKDVFGAWALLLQLTLYVGYFDFGIQTAVARFVAHSTELGDTEQRNSTISTAIVMLCGAAILVITVIAVLAVHIPEVFHQMPNALYSPAKYALLIMGCSFAIGLPFSAIHAYFIGMQKNEIPAVLMVFGRALMALFTIGAVLKGWGLVAMGAATALANLLSYSASIAAWRLCARRVRFRVKLISKLCARQIGGYSAALSMWLLSGFLISGVDLSIVGIFDYKSTAYYAIAATLTNFLIQTQGAIFAALLPASAMLSARGDANQLGRMLLSSTRYGMFIIMAMAVPLLFAGQFVIRIWAGSDYAVHSAPILKILIIANAIRLCALPYSTLLLGTGQQIKVLVSPFAEGTTNLAASVIGAHYLGAFGVAIGTLVGSCVSIGFHFLYNMPRTSLISIDRCRLIGEGIARPLLCATPLGVLWVCVSATLHLGNQIQVSLAAAALIGSALLFWNYGLMSSERQRVMQVIGLLT